MGQVVDCMQVHRTMQWVWVLSVCLGHGSTANEDSDRGPHQTHRCRWHVDDLGLGCGLMVLRLHAGRS